MISRFRWLLVASFVASWSTGALGQVSDGDIGSNASMLTLFPQLRSLPAPAFVVPGVRVSYASGAASGNGGPAGGGAIQYDVLTSDGAHVLAYQSNYGDVGAGPVVLSSGSVRGYPGLGAFWINPSVLAQAEQFESDTLSITRVTKSLADDTQVSVVRFQTTTQNGQTATEFDSSSGVMVFDSLTAGASAAQLQLIGARTLPLPWSLGRAPGWVRPDASWGYVGTQTTVIGTAQVINQLVVQASIVEAGARWSLTRLNQTLDGADQGSAIAATGQGQLTGALWLPVSALQASLSEQRKLVDTDPVTGAEVFVSKDAQGAITVELALPASSTRWTYHPTLGILDHQITEAQDLASNRVLELSRTGGDAQLEALAEQAPVPDDPQPGEGEGNSADGERPDGGSARDPDAPAGVGAGMKTPGAGSADQPDAGKSASAGDSTVGSGSSGGGGGCSLMTRSVGTPAWALVFAAMALAFLRRRKTR